MLQANYKCAIIFTKIGGPLSVWLFSAGTLEPSPAVSAATDEYRHDSDKISQFVEDVLTPDPNGEERTGDVYQHYKSWCTQNGLRYENQKNFKQALSAIARVDRKRPRGGGSETTLLFGYTLPRNSYDGQRTLWD